VALLLVDFSPPPTVVNFVLNSEENNADEKCFTVLMKNYYLNKYAKVTELLKNTTSKNINYQTICKNIFEVGQVMKIYQF
jgi:hypothetical protein